MAEIIICLVLGVVSFILAQIISVSQIVSFMRTKNTSGVSIWTYVIFVVAGAMCLIWGFSFYFQDMMSPATIPGTNSRAFYVLYQWEIIPIICYYITDFCMSNIMLIIKARHLRLCKKLHMDEIELSKYLLDKQSKKYFKSGKKFWLHPDFLLGVVLASLFTIVILFAVLFTLYARPKVQLLPVSFPWVLPTSLTAALLWEAISWPQFIKSLKEKDTSGISLNWAIFMPISLTVSFSYALALALKSGDFSYDTLGALIFNGMIVNYGILILKIRNIAKAKKMGLTEFEYTKKVLKPEYEMKQKAKLAEKPWLKKGLSSEQKKKLKLQALIGEAVIAKNNARELEKWKIKELNF